MPLPTLTAEQRKAALEKAAEARRIRAEFKKKLASRELSATKALSVALDNPTLAKMKTIDFLKGLPGIGPVTADEIMEMIQIARTRRLSGLGTAQLERVRQECERVDARATAVA